MVVSRGLLLYGGLSLVAMAVCLTETVHYAHQLQDAYSLLHSIDVAAESFTSSDSSPIPSSAPNVTLPHAPFESLSSVLSSIPFLLTASPSSSLTPRRLAAFFLRSKVNELVSLNLLIASLCLVLRQVQWRLFGPLSDAEKKACRENLFNFLVFRSVFIAAIVPLDIRELVVWCAFFALIATLRLLCIVARERFSTVTILPSATTETFVRLLLLIGGLLIVDVTVAAMVWWLVRAEAGLSVVALMLFENVVVLLGCLKVSGKYLIHILGMRREHAWEERNSYLYYCEFVFECLTQLLTILHYLHVWSFYGLSVTIIDLFLFLHLRSSFVVLVDRVSKYHHYRRASVEINSRYADATAQELQEADDFCAICRESMDSAKKLPCGHLFHRSCITQWMEYKGICPSCRAPLLHTATARETAAAQQRQQAAQQQQRLASMYPAQAAAHLAAQAVMNPPPSAPSTSPPVNDDNLEATMALIRQLQAQDAAQFGGLGFGMLNLGGGGGGRRRGGQGEAEEKAAEGGGQGGMGAHQLRGMLGRSLFHFNSRSIASWLPSFSFEVVRSVSDEPPLTAPHAMQHPAADVAPVHEERKEESGGSVGVEPRARGGAGLQGGVQGDEEKAAVNPPVVEVLHPAAPSVVRSTSDRSRREMILEATQRRLQGGSGSGSGASSGAVSPTAAAGVQTSAVPAEALHEPGLSAEEMDDGVYDDINCGRDGGQESEWSDEEELVRRISDTLESKEREVEVHPGNSPHPPDSRR